MVLCLMGSLWQELCRTSSGVSQLGLAWCHLKALQLHGHAHVPCDLQLALEEGLQGQRCRGVHNQSDKPVRRRGGEKGLLLHMEFNSKLKTKKLRIL